MAARRSGQHYAAMPMGDAETPPPSKRGRFRRPVFEGSGRITTVATSTNSAAATVTATATERNRYHVLMKWLVVAAILGYVGLRVYVRLRPKSSIARAFRRRYLLRTDTRAMSRKELLLSALSFLAFAVAAVALYFGVTWGASELGWRFFDARPVVVLAKAGLFVGAMALAASLFLVGTAVVHRD